MQCKRPIRNLKIDHTFLVHCDEQLGCFISYLIGFAACHDWNCESVCACASGHPKSVLLLAAATAAHQIIKIAALGGKKWTVEWQHFSSCTHEKTILATLNIDKGARCKFRAWMTKYPNYNSMLLENCRNAKEEFLPRWIGYRYEMTGIFHTWRRIFLLLEKTQYIT